MVIDYPLIWALLIALAVLIYVLLDGFDLGVGILFPFAEGESSRDQMMNSVAPIWDGNETWLVLGGGGLLATFPLAYAVILPALYAPLVVMLLALVLRGVAFEFRWKTRRFLPVWNVAFAGGSVLAALCQGIVLGAWVQGIAYANRAYAGGSWDWLTPFSVLCGVALVCGYALLGSTWLILKTQGALQVRAYVWARRAAAGLLVMIVLVSVWMLLLDPRFVTRWLSGVAAVYVFVVPLLVVAVGLVLFRALANFDDVIPFFAAQSLFLLSYIGLGIGVFPDMVPMRITIWQAAAPTVSLKFLLIGAAFLLPIILGYTAYSYWVFRGKVKPGEGYHD
ncbi:cytochrome d ubiquinol oxidase subunit II [Varunaivibrio sulfuroxidans]|uniref:Cytochrome bd-I ubiquinol oxidase subunit 2 apoprotein n=1 Tax=Varunaivibrio sulfuroxidans TaxID=1773489 RepID=A0A4V2UNI6_9PROT|nr:cytochrome d ubiquinol oxidase subunit II [Varunaivibrio sulfuroxidans]TCS62131.1 cytochrome bd-I ubiquinol oxidase subunit 2 apoprotein [Varunaivibrio sulfuroxidans]WES30563.1 cytochrome d ubiquinol oxidase subunit II [Varunaivibrio sulfuroxidans]